MLGYRSILSLLLLYSVFAQGQQQEQPLPVPEADLDAIKELLVRRHPELAESPGYRYTSFSPGIGEPGCEGPTEGKASNATRWVGIAGSSEGGVQLPQPTCSIPIADIYFAPYGEKGTRSKGAYARCYAPVTDQTVPPPWNWSCDEVRFREYVQIPGQSCAVTLIGRTSDQQIERFKEVGPAKLGEDRQDAPETLLKVVVHAEGRALAMFGGDDCQIDGGSIPTVFFLADGEAKSDSQIQWKVVDAEQWAESLGR